MPINQASTVINKQIELIEADFEVLRTWPNRQSDFSGVSADKIAKFTTSCLAFLERTLGRSNIYYEKAHAHVEKLGIGHPHNCVPLHGLIQAVKQDFDNGLLQTLEALVHANVFSDFVEMADHLLGLGYKDPAAVLLGGVLESHLRKLADLNGIRLDDLKNDVSVPRKAEMLNQDLGKAAYGLLEQKQITAWLDLRNKAAHGKYTEYQATQVELFSEGLKAFILRHPA